jgi:excisionase family DNA binding protein
MAQSRDRLAYTVPEAAELTGLSTDRIYELCRQGLFPHRRVGERQVLIPKRGLERWINGEDVGGDSLDTHRTMEH